MKVIHFGDAEKYEPEPDWKRASLCDQAGLSVEYFVKPPKHASPIHDHPNAQVTIVIKGRMIARTEEGEEAVLDEMDAAFFPPDQPHQIVNALDEPSIGIDAFAPGRSFDFWTQRLKDP